MQDDAEDSAALARQQAAANQGPVPAWERDMARMGAGMVDIDAKALYDHDREAHLAQIQANGGIAPGATAKLFSRTARSRHQLSAMAAQSRENEGLLAARKAQANKSKAETRAKYGW